MIHLREPDVFVGQAAQPLQRLIQGESALPERLQ
jgi:hypothetical protein